MEAVLKIILANFFKFFSKISPSLTAEIAWSFFCKPRIRKKPLSKSESKLLQQAQQYSIDSDEYKISVYKWKNINRSNHAKTILLTHGWGGHALNFSYIINNLIENGFNVVAYDSPAHGKSSGKQTNLFHNTRALLEVANDIEPIHALVGHSFGTITSSYALELSKNDTSLSAVEKIILVAGPNRLADIFASFTKAMKLPNSVLTIFHQKVATISKRKIESMSTTEFLQSYSGQALLIHDHNDRLVPFADAESVAENSTATLFATTGCGHFRILATKNVIDKIINFLSSTSNEV